MSEFIIKNVSGNIKEELDSIGFDKSYLHNAVDKFSYKNIKIFSLTIAQANILKQTAISVGADCAVHRETITAKIDKTNCLLGGSYSQLKKIVQKLKKQPFSLSKLADLLEADLKIKHAPLRIKNKIFDFKRPYLVGILNLTKDSFSDGGEFYDFESAKFHLHQLMEDGADIIDIGAESTKPFSQPVSDEKQLEKILPILDYIKKENIEIPISIDTRCAHVARICVEHGANLINDVSGLQYDSKMGKELAMLDVPVIIQHSLGSPEVMQINPQYEHLIDEIYLGLRENANLAIQNGVKPENIIIDPGVGFGKTKEQNFEIISRIEEFYTMGYPVMLGVSRKSLLNMKNETNEAKDIFTVALNSTILDKNVNFIRVHNIKLHKKLLELKGIE